MDYQISAFYKFVPISQDQLISLKQQFLNAFIKFNLKGTVLLATEGVNGNVAGHVCSVESFIEFMRSFSQFSDIEFKHSFAKEIPFDKVKVKIKKEVLTFNEPNCNPAEKTGTFVKAQDWNKVITDPEVLVVDCRNDYEVQAGTFARALDPKTVQFTEFKDFVYKNLDPSKHSKVAMFCTGGIRCEKASAFMLNQGFKEVFQLEGGVLKYLEEVQQTESLWQGQCFIFDKRQHLDHNLDATSSLLQE